MINPFNRYDGDICLVRSSFSFVIIVFSFLRLFLLHVILFSKSIEHGTFDTFQLLINNFIMRLQCARTAFHRHLILNYQ